MDLEPVAGGVRADLRAPLQYGNDTVDYVFHEHFIEHLSRDEGLRILHEIYRVLKPGGVLRFSTPDLKIIMNDYKKKKLDRAKGAWEPETPAQMVNGALRNWGHKFIYDQEEMELILGEAGFKEIEKKSYRKSDIADLADLEVRPYLEELIFEATK